MHILLPLSRDGSRGSRDLTSCTFSLTEIHLTSHKQSWIALQPTSNIHSILWKKNTTLKPCGHQWTLGQEPLHLARLPVSLCTRKRLLACSSSSCPPPPPPPPPPPFPRCPLAPADPVHVQK